MQVPGVSGEGDGDHEERDEQAEDARDDARTETPEYLTVRSWTMEPLAERVGVVEARIWKGFQCNVLVRVGGICSHTNVLKANAWVGSSVEVTP